MKNKQLSVAILGGGPVGLAAAAHLVERGQSFVLLEAGADIGENIRKWGHVRMFSPWKYNINKAATTLLQQHGWIAPPEDELPTGEELVNKYLRPLSNVPEIKPFLDVNSKVIAVGRKRLDKMKTFGREELPFVIHYVQDGKQKMIEARAVIDATGTWDNPNPIGSGGISAKGEEEVKAYIYYGIPDILNKNKDRYAGKKVLVVGSGHSAINTLLDLDTLKLEFPETHIVWVLRKKQINEAYGGGENDALAARGELGARIQQLVKSGRVEVYTPMYIDEIRKVNGALEVIGTMNEEEEKIEKINEIITNTGARPNMDFLREVRFSMDSSIESVPALADLIDPNIHSCGTVRPHGEAELRQAEKDFYIVGMKSYGRAPTFLLATGYEQVRSVVAGLVGDWEATKKVELELPETGVCSSELNTKTTCC